MKTNRLFLYLVMGLFGLMAQAQATIIFNFGPGSDDQHSLTVMDTTGTHAITVTAFKANGNDANIHRNKNGWGVAGRPGGNRMDNGEYLVFDLGTAQLGLVGGIFLDYRDGADEQFDLYVDGSLVLDDVTIPDALGGSSLQYIDLASLAASLAVNPSDLVGSKFKFVGGPQGRGTRLKQLVFVPEPTTLGLIGLGLAGLGFARKKKQI